VTRRGRCHTATRRCKQAAITWLAIYPTITLVLWLFEPLGLFDLPLPLRTLILTAVLVPVMVFVLMPTLTQLFGGWLRRGSRT